MLLRKPGPPGWAAARDEPEARPRVVIENADPAEQWVEGRALQEAGYEVLSCAGPTSLRGGACPVVLGTDCPGIAGADVVVSSLRIEKSTGREVIAGIRRRYPGTPVVVEAPPAAVADHAEVLEGCHVVFPLTSDTLLEAVETALAGTVAAPPHR